MSNMDTVNAQLIIIDCWQNISVVDLINDEYTIGRVGGPNDIGLVSEIVSSQHGLFHFANNTYTYIDLSSTNGTYVNGNLINGINGNPSRPMLLYDGDILTIGDQNDEKKVTIVFSSSYSENSMWHSKQMSLGHNITIGRNDNNDIVIPELMVSRKHAVINVQETGLTVTDNKSYNGTILNGEELRGTSRFSAGSVLRIGNSKIIRIDNMLVYNLPSEIPATSPGELPVEQTEHRVVQRPESKTEAGSGETKAPYPKDGVQVRVESVSKIVGCKRSENPSGKKKILNDISLVINPGELVAILGGSGSGKTTLMNCINGFEPATSGRILINGVDLYKNYQSLKSSIGYVPQQDIVYDNLTVKSMLQYACKLRLPNDVSKNDISKRVDDVIEMVDLKKQGDTYIKKLSGGQRKRASIAVELVSGPSLFFLDEPTSGLDPEAETNLMHRLRDLSRKNGKTIIVVTHTLQNIHLFDKIIFVAVGGELCYYGDPENAKVFFEVDNISDAYEKISQDKQMYIDRYKSLTKEGMNL